MIDLAVIGAGLAGLFAGALAARQGLSVAVVARGPGAVATGPGTVTLPNNRADESLAPALDAFLDLTAAHGLPFTGDRAPVQIPTLLGALRTVHLLPASLRAGVWPPPAPLGIVRLPGLLDFYPDWLCANLRQQSPALEINILELPLPGIEPGPDGLTALQLARAFDRPAQRQIVLKAWQQAYAASGQRFAALACPAVFGLIHTATILTDLEALFGCPVFEIPLLPPNPPGLRLFDALKAALLAHGGQLQLGPSVSGRIDRLGLASLVAHTPAGDRPIQAGRFLLATGGVENGGHVVERDGAVRDSVFGRPVASAGLPVNASGQPVDARGQVLARNLWAAGDLLTPDGPQTEGALIASAYRAVISILDTTLEVA